MPSKKRKYNARFPAGRIKRIMQADEEVGKIAHAVPVIISRTLELFVESLLTKSSHITLSRNAKTLSPTHLKQCIMSESRFDFLKDLVKNVPDISVDENLTNENEQQQQVVPVAYNGLMESNGGSSESPALMPAAPASTASLVITTTAGTTRVYQRSQSFQPSTSSSHHHQQPQQQYHNPQQKQFYLNNYTNTKPQQQQPHNPNMNHIEYRPPAKIVRINSLPSSTITSEQQQLQQFQKQLAPQPPLQQHHNIHKQSLAPLEFPIQISYNIDGPNNNSSSTDSPTVKIDYSKLSLPATSPSIKIDLSSFNSQQQVTHVSHMPPSNSASAALDEDYDA